MALRQELDKLDLLVHVVSAAGAVTFQCLGVIKFISIITPAADSIFDYDITDADSFGIIGAVSQTGPTTFPMDTPCIGKNILTIANASDGTYSVRLYLVSGI